MTIYQVAFKKFSSVRAEVQIQPQGAALPAGSGWVDAGDINHDAHAAKGADVILHDIRDAVFKQGWTDLSNLKINWDVISVNAGQDFNLGVGKTFDLKRQATVVPASGTVNKGLNYVSATPAKATVDANGIVTGVATGTSVITVTSQDDGTKTDTVTVTVV